MSTALNTYKSTIHYIMKPPFMVQCEFIERDTKVYNGVMLSEEEMITDAEDCIRFKAYIRRTDQEEVFTPFEGSMITHAELVTDDSYETPVHDFEIILDKAIKPGKNGKLPTAQEEITGCIKSKKKLLFTEANNKAIKLLCKGELKTKSGAKCVVLDGTLPIRLRFLKLFMRVLPGKKRYTSEIWAGLRVVPDTDYNQSWKLSGFKLAIKLEESSGFASLDPLTPEEQIFNNSSFVSWRISYTGITWENNHLAEFTVKVGLVENSGNVEHSLSYSFNVGRNLYLFLKEFNDAAPTLNLTNSDYNTGGAWDKYFPLQEYKGFFNNLKTFFGGSRVYECGELTARIFGWAVRRKFGSFQGQGSYSKAEIDRAETMNGIEIAYYAIAPIHSFFAFFPSNPTISPRFIDPWWYQKYDDACILDWSAQTARLTKLLSPILIPGGALIFASAVGTTLAALGVVLLSYLTLGTGGVVFSCLVNVGTKLYYGKYVFYLGDNIDQYMTAEAGCYDDYNNNGTRKISWGSKMLQSGEMDDRSYMDASKLTTF